MKRMLIIAAILIAAALAALLVVRRSGEPGVPDSWEGFPPYFVPHVTEDVTAVRCDFTNTVRQSDISALWQEPLQPCSLGTGWTNPADAGVVSIARVSMFDVTLPSEGFSVLLMTVKAFPNPDADDVQTMSIQLNGHTLDPVEVGVQWETIQVQVPAGVLRKGTNFVSATFGYRAPPAGENTKDYRLFSIHLREMVIARAPRADLSDREIDQIINDSVRHSPVNSADFDPRSNQFVISQPGTLVMPMAVPLDAERIEIHVDGSGSRGDQPTIELGVHSLSSLTTHRPEPPAVSGNQPKGHTVFAAEVSHFAGDLCLLSIDVGQNAEHGEIRVSPPRISRRQAPQVVETAQQENMEAPTSRPDIVLITLDAARARNFGCYGYARDTSPNIDHLAAESLVFENTFALAPYTLCSVPTMVTGLSFLDHQITDHGQQLSLEATTLAEYLKGVGYRTACFSATPNNSRSLGTNQGYDEFVETWKVVKRRYSADPFLLSRLATEWLDENQGSEPLHLQLHFVPPHAPYKPPPEYDVFTDPEYDGPADGSHRSVGALDGGLWEALPEDLAHVLDLYDGNLRAGDAAVAQVLDVLRRSPRWNNTVVLVTSDHGEAFLEHGRMSHNSTVFDEMLHVPFVLRLPEHLRPPTADLESLTTLADIVPTLLATAGIKPEPGVEGTNLLAQGTGEAPNMGRFLVARTGGNPPIYALRTARWKLLLSGSGQGALFDLEQDPRELHDLSLQARPFFVGLGRLLTQRLSRTPHFEIAAEGEEISAEDAEMLEALGYVQ